MASTVTPMSAEMTGAVATAYKGPLERMNMDQLKEELEKKEKEIEVILRYQGFHNLQKVLSEATDGAYATPDAWQQSDVGLPSNDKIFATITSPSDALQNVLDCLVNNALVSALILTISVALQLSPPEAIAVRNETDPLKVCFCFFVTLTSAMCCFLIVLAAQYTVAAKRSVRDSDKIRVLLHVDGWVPMDPTSLGVMCMYASAGSLIVSIIIGQYAAYGAYSLIFSAFYFLLFVIGCKVSSGFVFAGHVSYYWKEIGHNKDKTDPLDLRALDKVLEYKKEIGERLYKLSQEV